MRHNNIRDFEANLLSKVCNDMEIEPPLQPITTEKLPNSALKGDEARPDVRARGFWRKGRNAFFDVRVTNAGSESQRNVVLNSVLNKHERERLWVQNVSLIIKTLQKNLLQKLVHNTRKF